MSSISLASSPMTCKAPPQQGQLLSSTSTSTSTRGRCAGRAPRLRRRTRGGRGVLFLAATSSCAASAAAAACSRSSRPSWSWSGSSFSERRPNRPRCSCRIRSRSFSISAWAASRSARTVSRSASRAVLVRHSAGDDFRHLLQMLQQPLGVSRKVIQRQRHGAILLAEGREGQDFCSPGRARARDRAGLEPVPRQALEQRRELGAALKRTTPSAGDGQQNRPASSLFAYKTRPVPS